MSSVIKNIFPLDDMCHRKHFTEILHPRSMDSKQIDWYYYEHRLGGSPVKVGSRGDHSRGGDSPGVKVGPDD